MEGENIKENLYSAAIAKLFMLIRGFLLLHQFLTYIAQKIRKPLFQQSDKFK
jgi:hypothetical protein